VLLILKGNCFPSNSGAFMYVTNVPTNVRYLLGIKVLVIIQNILGDSLHISLPTFRIHFKFLSSHHLQLSSHAILSLICSISLSTLQLCFKITPFICFSIVPRINYIYLLGIQIFNTTPISKFIHVGHLKC
jgi:hypothetical protein